MHDVSIVHLKRVRVLKLNFNSKLGLGSRSNLEKTFRKPYNFGEKSNIRGIKSGWTDVWMFY